MRIGISRKWTIRLGLLAGLLLASLYLVSADGPEYTTDQKAYYADAAQVAFVRPGLVFKIVSATIGSDGTVQARFTVTDPKGLPLDRTGVYTPGTVSSSFILATIPKGQTQYISYKTSLVASSITGKSAIQAGADSGGTYTQNAIGDYTYTFKTKLPSGYDVTATHTIGLYGNRNLTEFDLGTNLADTTYNWVPDGSPVTVTRDVIKTLSCNKCHQDLSAHGSTGRKSLEVCILCHQPQTIDPDTGNTLDMVVMTHKIHMGEELPSVIAGTPYQIIGHGGSVIDFSTVVFPADPRRCTFCHEQNTGAAQKTAYLKPNRAACGACHDNVDFTTGANHRDIVQTSDKECILCHQAEGEIEFDGSVTGAHTIPEFSKELPGVALELLGVTGTAGTSPTVQFRIKNKAGEIVLPSQMNNLSLVLAGPSSDYATSVSEDPRSSAQVAGDGTATYTFKAILPANAKGSYSVGIQGYRNFTLQAGTDKQQTVRDVGMNSVVSFSVDGSAVAPRRTVVALDNCNKCHAALRLHGGSRNTIEFCVLCHNPNGTDVSQRPAAELPATSIDLPMMIHRIHTGENLGYEYVIYGHNQSRNVFSDVRFPGDRRRCNACHVNNSQLLPLPSGLLQVQDPNGYISPAGPATAACTACHSTIEAASHADINSGRLGESCTVCHGGTADFSVDKVHAQ